MLPIWLIVASLMVLPIIWTLMRMKKECDIAAGRCANCGYDLRASPERCPECGLVPTTSN
jgi:predicted Zn-ribbon and HTH transcriptional regulator